MAGVVLKKGFGTASFLRHPVAGKESSKMKVANYSERISVSEFARSNPVAVFWLLLILVVFVSLLFVFTAIWNWKRKKRVQLLVKQVNDLTEQLQVIIKQAGTMCWKYNVGSKSVVLLKNDILPERYLQSEKIENVPEYFVENQLIHPDSRKEFLKMYGKIQAGVKKVDGMFCARASVDSPWCWEKITYINRFDDKGKPLEALGFSNDVTLEMEQEIAMRANAEVDTLTCVFNRYAFARMTDELLQDRREEHAHKVLCIWNIDDFHLVNEHFGNQMGDRILRQFADVLKEGCRQTDLIGRMNGDEFLILFLDVYELEKLKKRIHLLLQHIQLITLPDGSTISASAGVTMNTGDEEIFQNLYERAREAMKEAKVSGGNCYRIK